MAEIDNSKHSIINVSGGDIVIGGFTFVNNTDYLMYNTVGGALVIGDNAQAIIAAVGTSAILLAPSIVSGDIEYRKDDVARTQAQFNDFVNEFGIILRDTTTLDALNIREAENTTDHVAHVTPDGNISAQAAHDSMSGMNNDGSDNYIFTESLRIEGALGIGTNSLPTNRKLEVFESTNGVDARARIQAPDSADARLEIQSENNWELRSKYFQASTANQGQFIVRADTSGTDYLTLYDVPAYCEFNRPYVGTHPYLQYNNGTDTSTNLATVSFTAIPIFTTSDGSTDPNSDFTVSSATSVTANFTGKVRLTSIISTVGTSAGNRQGIISQFFINGTGTGPQSFCYIRNNTNLDEGSNIISSFIASVTDTNTIDLRTQNNSSLTDTLTFSGVSSSYVLVERVS